MVSDQKLLQLALPEGAKRLLGHGMFSRKTRRYPNSCEQDAPGGIRTRACRYVSWFVSWIENQPWSPFKAGIFLPFLPMKAGLADFEDLFCISAAFAHVAEILENNFLDVHHLLEEQKQGSAMFCWHGQEGNEALAHWSLILWAMEVMASSWTAQWHIRKAEPAWRLLISANAETAPASSASFAQCHPVSKMPPTLTPGPRKLVRIDAGCHQVQIFLNGVARLFEVLPHSTKAVLANLAQAAHNFRPSQKSPQATAVLCLCNSLHTVPDVERRKTEGGECCCETILRHLASNLLKSKCSK